MTTIATNASGLSQDHWADELPRGTSLDAAALNEIPYTFLWRQGSVEHTHAPTHGGRHAESSR